MDKYKEVNWSEIARKSIEDYIDNRNTYLDLKEHTQRELEEITYLIKKLEYDTTKVMPASTEISTEQIASVTTEMHLIRNIKYPYIKINIKNVTSKAFILDRLLLKIQLKDKNNSDIDEIHTNYIEIISLNPNENREIEMPLLLTEDVRDDIKKSIDQLHDDINIMINTQAFMEKDNKIYKYNENKRQMVSYNQWSKWFNSFSIIEEKSAEK